MKFSNYLVVAAILPAALSLTGCMDDNDLMPSEVTTQNEYKKSWEKIFGAIDPNHDWSLTDNISVSVSVPNSSPVTFYALMDDGMSYKLKQCLLEQGTTSVSVQLPKGASKVYAVTGSGANYREAKITLNGGNGEVNFDEVKTRAAGDEIQDKDIKFFLNPNIEVRGNKSYENDGFTGKFYTINKWLSGNNYRGNQEAHMYVDHAHVDVENRYPYTMDLLKNLTNDNPAILKKYADANKIITLGKNVNGGRVTITTMQDDGDADAALGYCYTPEIDDPTELAAAIKKAPKYILIPSRKGGRTDGPDEDGFMKGNIVGSRYELAYFGENGTGAPQEEFPEGLQLHFFLFTECNMGGESLIPEVTDQGTQEDGSDQVCRIVGEVQLYSSATDLNETARKVANSRNCVLSKNEDQGGHGSTFVPNISTAAVFALSAFSLADGEMNFVALDDWHVADNLDWNDMVFWIDGVEPVKNLEEDLSWTVAFEDLGNTDDFDFNDVVVRIDHRMNAKINNNSTDLEWNNNYALVSLVAAGGTLPASISYGTKDFGEVHELLGYKDKDAKGFYPMINTEKDGATAEAVTLGYINFMDENRRPSGIASNITRLNWPAGADYSDLNKIDLKTVAAQIKIVVTSEDGTESSIELPVADKRGKAPYALCIPSPWAWPVERVAINRAYGNGFADWSKNAADIMAAKWYVKPADESLVHSYKPASIN